MDFSLQSTFEANYLNVGVNDMDMLDHIAVEVINNDCPEFLIPFRIVNVNDAVTLKYKLIHTIALEYFDENMTKKDFVRLYLNLMFPFINGKDWFLDYHSFCVDPGYIFVDRMTKEVSFIYIPSAEYHNDDETIISFFRDMATRVTLTDDAEFQVKLYQYFSKGNVTLAELYQMFTEENKKYGGGRTKEADGRNRGQNPEGAHIPQRILEPAHTPQRMPEPAQPAGAALPQIHIAPGAEPEPSKEPRREAAADNNDEIMQALFGSGRKTKEKPVKAKEKAVREKAPKEKKKTGGISFFGKRKDNASAEPQGVKTAGNDEAVKPREASQEYGVRRADAVNPPNGFAQFQAYDDRTEISSEEDGAGGGAYMQLTGATAPGAPEIISLDFAKPYIIIGRESADEVQPDVAFPRRGFERIGRKHVRIERRGSAVYIIDLGSANHTLVNNQVLIPNRPVELVDGCEVAFTESKVAKYRVYI